MVFSSLVFLCIFLPIVFLGHTILPGIRAKNAMLLLASLVFYAYGEPVYVLLMIFSIIINYLHCVIICLHFGSNGFKIRRNGSSVWR